MFAWVTETWRKWVGGGPSPSSSPPTAAELMAEMKASRASAAPADAWAENLAIVRSQVFSSTDRSRLWRRARRRYPGEVQELRFIDAPDTHDLAALRDIVRDLTRG